MDLLEYVDKARDKIKEHASRAISALEEQLATAKSQNKICKLKHRIQDWKNSLNMLDKKDEKKEG